ncbi:integral membrane protein [Mycolicibacterium rhodesiae JS60]|nr:integral membrane protein [Mycolicibacterium rhodesiae JS60]
MRPIPLEIRKAAAVIAIAIVLASTFAAAYTVALGRPSPRNLPVGVVGSTAVTAPFVAALHKNSGEFDVHQYATRDDAVTAINQERIIAAIDATASTPELLLSSASDPSGTRALIQLDQTQPGQFILPIVDLHPLPPSDPAGLATFYLVIAATILGFITMFQLRANVKTLNLRRWLACLAALAVLGGAALSAVTGPVLGALSTPFPQLWLLTSVQIAIAAAFNSAMLVLIHRWAIIPTWLVFILLGNTSSGGAVSASLLPQPFAFFNHALPSGATVSAIHAATYFPHNQRPLPFIVLALWLVGSLVAAVVASRALHRSPAQ